MSCNLKDFDVGRSVVAGYRIVTGLCTVCRMGTKNLSHVGCIGCAMCNWII